MKKIILVFALVCLSICCLRSQSLMLSKANTSNWPIVSTQFFVLDSNGVPVSGINSSNFSVTDNNIPRTDVSVSCPTPRVADSISSVLTIDISSSMLSGGPRINFAKSAAIQWVRTMPMGRSECALTSFNEVSFINHGMTTDSTSLINSINGLAPFGGTNYNEALLNEFSGALSLARTGTRKKIVVFITDGLPGEPTQTEEIIAQANAANIRVYCITLGIDIPEELKQIANSTGGAYYSNVTDISRLQTVFSYVLLDSQGFGPCTLSWSSFLACNPIAHTANVTLNTPFNISKTVTYNAESSIYSVLSVPYSQPYFEFGCVPLGSYKDTNITVRCYGEPITVTDITSDNPKFTITGYGGSAPPFTLQSNQTRTLSIRYTPTDTLPSYANYHFVGNMCNFSYLTMAARCTTATNPGDEVSLKIVYPNTRGILVACNDDTIRWTGVPADQRIVLEYSTGWMPYIWHVITDSAVGFSHVWHVPYEWNGTWVRIRASLYTPGSRIENDTVTVYGESKPIVLEESPDHTKYAIWNASGEINIIDKSNGSVLATSYPNWYHYVGNELHWSPAGDKIAVVSEYLIGAHRGTGIINAITGDYYGCISNSTGLMLWNHDGSQIAILMNYYNQPDRIDIYDSTGVFIRSLAEQRDITSFVWGRNNNEIISAGTDSTFIYWDVASGIPTRSLRTNNYFQSIKKCPGSDLLLAKIENYAVVFNIATGDSLASNPFQFGYFINSFFWADGCSTIVAADNTSTNYANIHSIDAITGVSKVFIDLPVVGHMIECSCPVYNSNLNEVSILIDGTIYTYSLTTGALTNRMKIADGGIQSVSFNTNGSKIATSDRYSIRIRDVESGITDRIITDNYHLLSGLQWSPTGNQIVAMSDFSCIKFWNSTTGNLERTINDAQRNFRFVNSSQYAFRWSPDGTKFAYTTRDTLYILNSSDYSLHSSYYCRNWDCGVYWSPDSRRVLLTPFSEGYSNASPMVITIGSIPTIQDFNFDNLGNHNDLYYSWHPDCNSFFLYCSGYKYRANLLTSQITQEPMPLWENGLFQDYFYKRKLVGSASSNINFFNGNADSVLKSLRLEASISPSSCFAWCQDSSKLMAAVGSKNGAVEIIRLSAFHNPAIADTSDDYSLIAREFANVDAVYMGSVASDLYKDSLVLNFIHNDENNPGSPPAFPTLHIDTMFITGEDANCFSIISNAPPYAIRKDSSTGAEIRFAPGSIGLKRAVINLVLRCDTIRCNIYGNGVERFVFTRYQIIDFGKVKIGGHTDSTVIAVYNTGPNSAVITSAPFFGPDSTQFAIITGGAPFVLAPNGGSHQMDLRFAPIRAGKTSTQLGFVHSGIGSPVHTLLIGEGVEFPIISTQPNISFAYSSCGSAPNSRYHTISNTGGEALIIDTILITGNDPKAFSLGANYSGLRIPPMGKDSVKVIFNANYYGTKTATLRVVSNSNLEQDTTPIQIVAVRDRTEFTILSEPASDTLFLGTTCPGSLTDTSISIQNTSTIASRFTCSAISSPYSVLGTNPFSSVFAVNEIKQLRIRFTNSNTGVYITNLVFADSCGNSKKLVLKAVVSVPIAHAGADQTICRGNTVAIGAVATGGLAPYSYSWSPASGLTDPGVATPSASPVVPTTYFVTVTDALGCIGRDTVLVDFFPNSVPKIDGSTSTCVNSTETYTATQPGTNNWSVVGGSVIGALNSNSIRIKWDIIGSHSVKLVQTNASGCKDSVTISVSVNDRLNPSIDGAINSCSNSTEKYSAVQPGTCEWSVVGGSIIGAANTRSIDVSWASVGNKTVKLVQTNASGCKDSTSIAIIVSPLPTPVINGDNELCVNQISRYTSPQPGTNLWQVLGGNIIGSANASSIDIEWTNAGTGTIVLVQTTSAGCKDSTRINVIVHELPKPIISGNSSSCLNTTEKYTSENPGTYEWFANGGIIQGSSTQSSVRISWNQTGSNLVKLILTNSTGCKDSTTYDVTVHQLPIPEISGNTDVCVNASETYSTTQTGAFEWFVNGGTIVGESNTNTVRVVWTKVGSNSIKLIQSNEFGCKDSISKKISVFPAFSVSLADSIAVCPDSIITLKPLVSGGSGSVATAEWTPIMGLSDPTVLTPVLQLSTPGEYKYYLKVTDITNCVAYDSIFVRINDYQAIILSESVLDFGLIGSCQFSKDTSITISNYTHSVLSVSEITGANGFEIVSPAVPFGIKPNEQKKIVLRYTPITTGIVSNDIIISGSPCSWSRAIHCSGQKDYVSITPELSKVNFGATRACESVSKDTAFFILNSGLETVTYYFDEAKINTPFSLVEPKITKTAQPHDTIVVKVSYQTSQSGSFNDELIIPYAAGECHDTMRIAFTAVVSSPEIASGIADSLVFSPILECESNSDTTIYIVNNGNLDINLTELQSESAFEFVGTMPVIKTGETKGINIKFAPNLPGDYTAKLLIQYSPCELFDTIYISGSKSRVLISYSDTIDFGDVLLCRESQKSMPLRITNSSSSGFVPTIKSMQITPPFFTNLVADTELESGENIFSVSINLDDIQNNGVTLGKVDFITTPCDSLRSIYFRINKANVDLAVPPQRFIGRTNVGTECSDTIEVTNTGSVPTNLSSIAGFAAPFRMIKTIPELPAQIAPGENMKIVVGFAPTSVGEHSIIIETKSIQPCELSMTTIISGIGINLVDSALCFVSIDSTRAKTQKTISIPLRLVHSEKLIKTADPVFFYAVIRFNATVIVPLFEVATDTIFNNERIVGFGGSISSEDGIMKDLQFLTTLGNAECTTIGIDSIAWLGIPANTIQRNGQFCLTDVCLEGGPRLINPDGTVRILAVVPNPSSDKVSIDIELIEKGVTELLLTNNLGQIVRNCEIRVEKEFGKRTIEIELEELPSGWYSIVLVTPTEVIHKPLLIVK